MNYPGLFECTFGVCECNARLISQSSQGAAKLHELFHVGRDHAMCNIQNRSIPVAQLTEIQKMSNKSF
jgi:hypothetical protein